MVTERVLLTGFMGSGKTTVGRKTAELLEVAYDDVDDRMEKNGIDLSVDPKTHMPLFRAIETHTVQTMLRENLGVISTGGGVICTEIGRKVLLAADARVVWLRAPFDAVEERIKQDDGRVRPFFNPSNIDAARALYEERLPWYDATADCVVDASLPLDQVVDQVIEIARIQI